MRVIPRVVAPGLAGLLLSGCVNGCGGADTVSVRAPDAPGQQTVAGPPEMSVGTLRSLGSHVWEASFVLRGDRAGVWPSREVVSKLIWSELDFWEFEEVSAGTQRLQRQVDRDLFRRQGDDPRWIQSVAPAGNALILQRQLQLWTQAVSGFEPQVAWRELADDVLEGRPVRVLRVELAPVPAPDGPIPVNPTVAGDRMGLTTRPLELTGTVYVDIQTGCRLLAELEGRFIPRAVAGGRDPSDEVHVTYREKRTLTTLPPTIAAPPAEQVVSRPLRPRSPDLRPPGVR